MAHVTFIHGIANKPPSTRLHDLWLRELAAGGLDLGAEGVTSGMVYWADVLYEAPEPLTTSFEGVAEVAEVFDAVATAPLAPSIGEAAFIAGLAAKIGGTLAATDLMEDLPGEKVSLERVPLPWPVKKLFLEAFLRDVHHYLFDVESRPRTGEAYRVRQTVRSRFVEEMKRAPAGVPHVVVSHSMGTVIAYDCFKNVVECPPADALFTIGSPLGLDEIQDKLSPGYSTQDGFPGKVGRWWNIYDRLDPVCGFDPLLANDYRQREMKTVTDVGVKNIGRWRHSIAQYLQRAELLSAFAEELGL